VEFVGLGEVWSQLKARGIIELSHDASALELGIDPIKQPVTVALGGVPSGVRLKRQEPAITIDCPSEYVAATLETVLHKLHLAPLYLIPVRRWREIVDVIGFELSIYGAWQAIDSEFSLQQNTRDALECGPRDLHMLREIVRVLLTSADADDAQALTLIATGQVLVARVQPRAPIRILVGNAKVAEQLRDAARHYLAGLNGGSGGEAPHA
jgi:hypothetical protein